jgi:hypothetical protein
VGVDVDGPAYHLHRPTAYGCQPRAQGPLNNAALLGRKAFPMGATVRAGPHTTFVR